MTKPFIGAGEDTAFQIIKEVTGLHEANIMYYPEIGLYRQVPVFLIYNSNQLHDLAPSHRKSSIDIMIVACKDHYNSRLCKIAVRVEGKKGSYKMVFQGVQASMLKEHCQIVDLHKRECPELFKDILNEQSRKEVFDGFRTAKVEIPGVLKIAK